MFKRETMIYNQNNAVMTLKSNGKIINALYHPKRYNLPSSKPKQELLASLVSVINLQEIH